MPRIHRNLTGVTSGGIAGTPSALCSGCALTNGHLVGPGVNLTNAILTGANLVGVNLTGAILTAITSGGITGAPTQPSGWLLFNGYLIGHGAILVNANLTSGNLTGADLTGADLTGTTLAFTDFTNADFTDANLTGAFLDMTRLGGATLTGANLSSTFFRPQEIRGLISGGITGTPVSLGAGCHLVNGYLVCPDVNLTNANLSGTDLSGIDFNRANLTNADLRGATITYYPGAVLWFNTTCPDGTNSSSYSPQTCVGH